VALAVSTRPPRPAVRRTCAAPIEKLAAIAQHQLEAEVDAARPATGVKDFAEFDRPRLTNVPARMPLPPAKRRGSIYETRSASKKSCFAPAA